MKKIPVLLLTTLSDPEEIFRGLKNGADNFVIKPYDEKLLLSRIRHIFINQEMRSRQRTDIGIDIFLGGKRHYINSDRIQILDLLVSTYEHSLKQKRELERINRELKEALETVKTLEGILPICSGCKKIREDDRKWYPIEEYIHKHTKADFTHGICPECFEKLYPDFV